MATVSQLPRAHHFKLEDGMELQVSVAGFLSGQNAKVEIQLKNCSRAWILHWGCTYLGNRKWFFPADHPSGTKIYKQMALQIPFVKKEDVGFIVIELQDPRIHAIEFVLKDGRHNQWLKLNQGNFQIQIPKSETSISPPPIPIPKDLIERKAYLIWESKGRPLSSPIQQKHDYDDAVRELQYLLSKGISLDELQSGSSTASNATLIINKEQLGNQTPYSFQRRHDVGKWLHKFSKEDARKTTSLTSALINAVEKSMGGDNVILLQSYHVSNYELVVFFKVGKR